MNLGISFAPLVPDYVVWAALGVAVLIGALLMVSRSRGAWIRVIALLLMVLALANPSLTREDRDPIPSVAAVIIDKSPSQDFGDRNAQTAAAQAQMVERLKKIPGLEVRVAEAGAADGETDGTRLFSALSSTLADVPPDRIAGAVLITDGRVHDVPADVAALGFAAPLHALITGHANEIDRRVVLTQTPRFGIVGQAQTIGFKIEDQGANAGSAQVTIRRDGEVLETRSVAVGAETKVNITIPHAGANIVEVEASALEGELTPINNRAVISIDGVRDKLRVLLVSGEPHAGERTWRNLLKSDASVDLVHFTILRPPDKQDSTPINELSLIAFPSRELFQEKLGSFDLVVFDRYRERGVLPLAYFQNLASYVQDGGALLISSGPEFAGPESIYRTPLSQVLPVQPTGQIVTGPFKPIVTADGLAHPVTRELPGRNQDKTPPTWGRWFRLIGANKIAGQTVMAGGAGQPLLVLDRVGKGRIAELMSDQTWLWARGFEGGGPQAELLRRLAHWLMKEPELESEMLSATIVGDKLQLTRRTMAAQTPAVTLTMPSGKSASLPLTKAEPGIWRAEAKAGELGLYRATDGILSAVAAAGPLNPKEVADMRATDEVLKPDAQASGGSVHWLEDGVPDIRRVDAGDTASGSNWIGLRSNGAYRVTALEQEKLLPQWLALLLIVGALLLAWRLEGR